MHILVRVIARSCADTERILRAGAERDMERPCRVSGFTSVSERLTEWSGRVGPPRVAAGRTNKREHAIAAGPQATWLRSSAGGPARWGFVFPPTDGLRLRV